MTSLPESKEFAKAFETFVSLSQKYDAVRSQLDRADENNAKIMAFLHELQGREGDLKAVKNQHECFETSVLDSLKSIWQAIDDHMVKVDTSHSVLISQEAKIKEAALAAERVQSAYQDSHQKLMDHITRLEEQAVKAHQFKAHVEAEGLQITKIGSLVSDLQRQIESFQFKFGAHADMFGSLSMRIESIEKSISTQIEDLMKKVQGVSQKVAYLNDAIETKVRAVFDRAMKEIDDCKSQVKSAPDAIQQMKEDLEQKVELSSLDASNAFRKATVAETQFRLLDRKLENVLQLLKQLEIG